MIFNALRRFLHWRQRRMYHKHKSWLRRNRVILPDPQKDPRDWYSAFNRVEK